MPNDNITILSRNIMDSKILDLVNIRKEGEKENSHGDKETSSDFIDKMLESKTQYQRL
jgi:hypothetical protein